MNIENRLNNRVVPVNKAKGITTFDVIRKLKKVVDIKKVGHAGSLDPIASGLVLILTGEATKLSNYLMDLPKTYHAEIKIGEATDTQDATGEVVRRGDWGSLAEEDISAVLHDFIGKRFQKPPMYSALKHNGRPLYKLARMGKSVKREPREIETHDISLLKCDLPYFMVEVECSRGLYVRTLAEEIGARLGVPSHLSGLVRTAIGHFGLESALSIEDFDSLDGMKKVGQTAAEALRHMPAYHMDEAESAALLNGISPKGPVGGGIPAGTDLVLIRPEGRLGGIAEAGPAGLIKLKRVLSID